MICEKCGFSNEPNAGYCRKCAEKLPNTSGGNGFADILSYNEQNAKASHFNSETYITAKQMNHLKRKLFWQQTLSFGLIAIAVALGIIGIFSPQMDTEQVSERVLSQLSDEVNFWTGTRDEEIQAMVDEADETMALLDEKMAAVDEEIEQIREMQALFTSSEEMDEQLTEDENTSSDSPTDLTNLDSVSSLDQESENAINNQTESPDNNLLENQDQAASSSEIKNE